MKDKFEVEYIYNIIKYNFIDIKFLIIEKNIL